MTTDQAVEDRPLDTFEMRLYLARWHRGRLNPKQAAILVGVSDTTWRNWEKGLHVEAAKKPWMLREIAEKMRVSPIWLEEGGPLRTAGSPDPEGPAGNDADLVELPRLDSNQEPSGLLYAQVSTLPRAA